MKIYKSQGGFIISPKAIILLSVTGPRRFRAGRARGGEGLVQQMRGYQIQRASLSELANLYL